MSVILGRNSRIKLGTTTIAKMTTFELAINNEMIDITSFGDEWAKFARGMQSWTASVSGHIDLDDASQSTLVDAAEDGTILTNLRFYIDSTTYFAVNLVEDADAGCFVNSYTPTSDNNSTVKFTMAVTGSGPLQRYPA
jgi:predicted secreted protein